MAARAFARVAPVRARVALCIMVAIAFALALRLADVQVRRGPMLARKALDQRSATLESFARRGPILDRDGAVLVRSLPSESIYAVPSEINDAPVVAAALAPIVGYPPARIAAALHEKSEFRWIKRKVPHDVAMRVQALKLDGIGLKAEETGVRYVPAGRLASSVIGIVGTDENGLEGVEYRFDDALRGVPGRMRIETDNFGRAIPFAETTVIDRAVPGRAIELTIDSYLQFEAERALHADVQHWHARSGTAIIMDPHSGEILALANVPDFDPSRYGSASPDARRDRAIADAYEPGSTFKLVTAAAALESGRVHADDRFPARDEIDVGGRTIHNAEDGFMAGAGSTESLEDIIAYSHNVGAAQVGMATGAHALYKTIRAFGFGDETKVELAGENPGIVPPVADWSGSSLATISFGHGISTTPLAMARAYCAIANGGWLLRPHIVHALTDERGTLVATTPTIEGRVLSPAIAATLQRYLRAVIGRGTGATARVPGYTVAGKTGTAQVVENGHYEPGAYVGSFIGYVPAEQPRFVILVKIERPQGAYYGGVVAAPVFAELARVAMLHAGVMPAAAAEKPRLVRAGAMAKRGR